MPLAFGSDYPVADPRPWQSVASAVHRRNRTGTRIHPDEELSGRRRRPGRDHHPGGLGQGDICATAAHHRWQRDPPRTRDPQLLMQTRWGLDVWPALAVTAMVPPPLSAEYIKPIKSIR